MRCLLMIVLVVPLGLLSGCAEMGSGSPVKPVLELSSVQFPDIPGWDKDRHAETLVAFARSCERFAKLPPEKETGLSTKAKDWQSVCANLPAIVTDETARRYFETQFIPYMARDSGRGEDGLFTGYYEASLRGSPVRGGVYQTPLRARPSDLVMVNLGDFRPEFKGQRIAGRVNPDGYLKPYEDRAAIENGKLPPKVDIPLYWVDSAVDAFFLQVQGSGVVTLPDGSTQRIGYDGQNGHTYKAIGKELIVRGELNKDTVSMQSIRAWLAAHPDKAAEVMQTNPSYVFFKKLDTSSPLGAEGVPLTPQRSLAVDHTVWPYGLPVFVSAEAPEQGEDPIRRLMVAQDTGGAIIGVVRGDMFWGYGDRPAHLAGVMKASGQMWALLPRTVVPSKEE